MGCCTQGDQEVIYEADGTTVIVDNGYGGGYNGGGDTVVVTSLEVVRATRTGLISNDARCQSAVLLSINVENTR